MDNDSQEQVQEYLHNATYFQAAEQYDEAIAEAEKALALDPRSVGAWYTLGDIYMELGRPSEAVQAFEKAVMADPRHAAARIMLGNAYLQLERPHDALAQMKSALEQVRWVPAAEAGARNLQWHLMWADRAVEALLKHDQLDMAAQMCQVMVTRVPELGGLEEWRQETLSGAHGNLGIIHFRSGRPAEALKAFEQALVIDPEHWDWRRLRGLSLWMLGRPREALPVLCDVLDEVEGRKPFTMAMRVGAEDSMAHRPGLAQSVREDIANCYIDLAREHGQAGRLAECIQEARRAVETYPSARGYYVLGLGLLDANKARDAAQALEQAVTLEPGSDEYREALAEAKRRSRRRFGLF